MIRSPFCTVFELQNVQSFDISIAAATPLAPIDLRTRDIHSPLLAMSEALSDDVIDRLLWCCAVRSSQLLAAQGCLWLVFNVDITVTVIIVVGQVVQSSKPQ